MSTLTTSNIMDLLKDRTSEHHRRAEQQPLQQALVKGTATRDQYAAWLGQMMHIHTALEHAIEKYTARERRLAVATAEQFGHARLAADLRTLGIDPTSVTTSAATAAVCGQIRDAAAANPVTLLGFHYVLEGSKNGNRYIAMALRRGLGLTPGTGDTYLDPYGDEQRPKWAAFRASMGAQSYTEAETEAVIAAAGMMFDGVSAVCAAIA
jgi:heme oxygenase